MNISIVAAVAKNNVIGKADDLPWHIPEDLKRFKKLTTGKTVLMGRKTYDSIVKRLGKPLPDRKNIVITRQHDLKVPDGVVVLHHLKPALKHFAGDELVIIGGGEVFNQTFHLAGTLHITHVHSNAEGNVFFPEIKEGEWEKLDEEQKDGYSFATYKRIQ
jgi:dihydrofolate reductase